MSVGANIPSPNASTPGGTIIASGLVEDRLFNDGSFSAAVSLWPGHGQPSFRGQLFLDIPVEGKSFVRVIHGLESAVDLIANGRVFHFLPEASNCSLNSCCSLVNLKSIPSSSCISQPGQLELNGFFVLFHSSPNDSRFQVSAFRFQQTPDPTPETFNCDHFSRNFTAKEFIHYYPYFDNIILYCSKYCE